MLGPRGLTAPKEWPAGASPTMLDDSWLDSMPGTFDDLVSDVQDTVDSVTLAREVTRAIKSSTVAGSARRSCTSARTTKSRRRSARLSGTFCRASRAATWSACPPPRSVVIDMSTLAAQQRLVQELLDGLVQAQSHKEGVLLRKGTVPWSIFERCNEDDGQGLGTPLWDRCSRAPWSHARDAIGRSVAPSSPPSVPAAFSLPGIRVGPGGMARIAGSSARSRCARARKHEAARRTPGSHQPAFSQAWATSRCRPAPVRGPRSRHRCYAPPPPRGSA